MPEHVLPLARRRLLAAVGGTLLITALPSSALGRVRHPTDAESVVQGLVERLFHLLRSGPAGEPPTAELIATIDRDADLELLGRLVLGRYWRRATPEQRVAYQGLFRDFMLQTFARRLRPYAAVDLGRDDDRFAITASRRINERDVLVHSRLMPPEQPPLRLDWRLRRRAERPVVIDLIVEGVSLLVTQRAEFAAVIERYGMDGLLEQLRRQVTTGQAV